MVRDRWAEDRLRLLNASRFIALPINFSCSINNSIGAIIHYRSSVSSIPYLHLLQRDMFDSFSVLKTSLLTYGCLLKPFKFFFSLFFQFYSFNKQNKIKEKKNWRKKNSLKELSHYMQISCCAYIVYVPIRTFILMLLTSSFWQCSHVCTSYAYADYLCFGLDYKDL